MSEVSDCQMEIKIFDIAIKRIIKVMMAVEI